MELLAINHSCKKMPHPSSPLWIAFILGRPILITTEGPYGEKGILSKINYDALVINDTDTS